MDFEIKQEIVLLSLNSDELTILSNLVNEAMMELEDWEFSTRVGGERQEAVELHSIMHAALERLGRR